MNQCRYIVAAVVTVVSWSSQKLNGWPPFRPDGMVVSYAKRVTEKEKGLEMSYKNKQASKNL